MPLPSFKIKQKKTIDSYFVLIRPKCQTTSDEVKINLEFSQQIAMFNRL